MPSSSTATWLGSRPLSTVRPSLRFRQAAVLIDRYLSDATEVDVDAIADGKDVFIAGIMEHIEEAGIHSGDSACSLPPHSLRDRDHRGARAPDRAMAQALKSAG